MKLSFIFEEKKIVKGGSNSGDHLNLRENPYLVVTKLTENATSLFFYQNCKK
jgi:hypothetical protein